LVWPAVSFSTRPVHPFFLLGGKVPTTCVLSSASHTPRSGSRPARTNPTQNTATPRRLDQEWRYVRTSFTGAHSSSLQSATSSCGGEEDDEALQASKNCLLLMPTPARLPRTRVACGLMLRKTQPLAESMYCAGHAISPLLSALPFGCCRLCAGRPP
jgi:hypothetical protein